MGWHYIAVAVENDITGETEYTVGEAYPDLESEGDTVPHTIETHFYGETVQDLVKWLRIAADDIEKHGCVNSGKEDEE